LGQKSKNRKRIQKGLDRVKASIGINTLGDFHDLKDSRQGKSSLVKALILNPRRLKSGVHRAKLFTMDPFGQDFASTQFERRSVAAQTAMSQAPTLIRPLASAGSLNAIHLTGTREQQLKKIAASRHALAAAMSPTDLAKQAAAIKAAKAAASAKSTVGPRASNISSAAALNTAAKGTTSGTRSGGYGSMGLSKGLKPGSSSPTPQPGQDRKPQIPTGGRTGAGYPGRG